MKLKSYVTGEEIEVLFFIIEKCCVTAIVEENEEEMTYYNVDKLLVKDDFTGNMVNKIFLCSIPRKLDKSKLKKQWADDELINELTKDFNKVKIHFFGEPKPRPAFIENVIG